MNKELIAPEIGLDSVHTIKHMQDHKANGDFNRWGSQGGKK